MARKRSADNPNQIEFSFVAQMQRPCVFNMTRAELLDYLPKASKVWLFAVIIAMFDELNDTLY